MRKIAVITGTRAEYGHLYHIIKGIHEDPELELQLIVTSMHLSPEFGMTVHAIEKDGFPVADKVEMLLSSDTDEGISISMGLGMIGFAKAYTRLKPDIMVLLGDRSEIHAAASAAAPFRIPIAHIHGGETTEGAIDELFRHSITKLSHLHFTATKAYADRIKQMGEGPDNIFVTGAPGLDSIVDLPLLSKVDLAGELGLPADREWGVVTFHPATLETEKTEDSIKEILQALDSFHRVHWVFTFPNADTSGRTIINHIREYAAGNDRHASVFISLGQLRYLSALKAASVMVGNSSSGIIEAPSFELPVVNIGSRQEGRIRAKNVIDVPECISSKITDAVRKALSPQFRETLKGLENPYGDGTASSKILQVLKNAPLSGIMKKHFYDI
ncbi:MAG: UDP-N-acetylglucosamine 2-epimerase (hydrolyzing) [Nitrospiraceae bacterium]|nr:MAG: UDP-N-acetylglucosamine 2-epimerase (hydrolyzing) [Nitrospiraceae bacterium]